VIDDTGHGAEFALMVAAAWRRLGVGSLVLGALQSAANEAGLRWLHGSVMADNAPMLALMQHSGFLCAPSRGDAGLVAVEARVDSPVRGDASARSWFAPRASSRWPWRWPQSPDRPALQT
jgi:GNAT superfamily N-acetyltransferase